MILIHLHIYMHYMVWNLVRPLILIWRKNLQLQNKTTGLYSKQGLIESAHDVAEGGLFVTLAESGFHRELGFSVSSQDESIPAGCILVWGITEPGSGIREKRKTGCI